MDIVQKYPLSISKGQGSIVDMNVRKHSKSQDSEDRLINACLRTIRGISDSLELEFVLLQRKDGHGDGEIRVRLRRHGRAERFIVETTRTHLSYALASGLIERARTTTENWVLFAPYIPGKMGSHLASQKLSYADTVGNCHLENRAGELLVHVEGKRPVRDPSERMGLRVPSYQLIFAILAQPDLLGQPLRQIAEAAGIGKSTVGEQLKRLIHQGLIARGRKKHAILRQRELLDRWLSAYPDVVRPAWLQGTYRTQAQDPEAIEEKVEQVWGEARWAFGGGAAAWRMTRFYRGKELVLHVAGPVSDNLRRLRALPADDGSLTILRTPGTTAYAGTEPHLAHPLLVYSEMAASGDPRMREAAEQVRETFLGDRR